MRACRSLLVAKAPWKTPRASWSATWERSEEQGKWSRSPFQTVTYRATEADPLGAALLKAECEIELCRFGSHSGISWNHPQIPKHRVDR